MNRAAIDSSVAPLEPFPFSALSVPSLDELYQKMCVPDQRVVIRGVDWAFYEHLVDSIPEGWHIHVDYDGKDLEMMSPISPFHDEAKKLLGQFVEAVAQELGIPYKGLGQTTWKRFEVARGLESDECYYFKPEKLAAADAATARRSKDVADYPNPGRKGGHTGIFTGSMGSEPIKRYVPLCPSLTILSRPETLDASGSRRACRMANSRNARSLLDFPQFVQAVRYGVPGTPVTFPADFHA